MAETAPRRSLSQTEAAALVVALLGHVALFAVLILYKPADRPPPPERMTVTLSDDVGLAAASPEQKADAALDRGPQQGDAAPPPEPIREATVAPLPMQTASANAPRQATRTPPPRQPALPQRTPRSAGNPGSSAFDNAFAKGIPAGKPTGTAANAPAPITGPIRSSLAAEVARQLKRKWQGPNGLEVEKLATTVEWDLNPDGTLAGAPRLVAQTGVTDANRPQARRHIEQALRAVRLAAPFQLPPQYYSAWRHLRYTFDWKINQ